MFDQSQESVNFISRGVFMTKQRASGSPVWDRIQSWIPMSIAYLIIAGVTIVYIYNFGLYWILGGLLVKEPRIAREVMITFLCIYHFLLFLVVYCYCKTIWTDPGSPLTKLEQVVDAPAIRNAIMCKSSGELRFCDKCQCYKPDRTHHCSVCNRCILKMDHHCPWVNNCIGHGNYKFFVLFLFYTALLCAFSAVTLLWATIITREELQVVFGVVGFCVTAFACSVGCLFSLHFYLVLKNKTTIEHLCRVRVKKTLKYQGHSSKAEPHPFHLGWRKNLNAALGPSAWLWLVPMNNVQGNGMEFEVLLDETRLL